MTLPVCLSVFGQMAKQTVAVVAVAVKTTTQICSVVCVGGCDEKATRGRSASKVDKKTTLGRDDSRGI